MGKDRKGPRAVKGYSESAPVIDMVAIQVKVVEVIIKPNPTLSSLAWLRIKLKAVSANIFK